MKKEELNKEYKRIMKRGQKELLAMAKKVNKLEKENWKLKQQLLK